MKNCVILRRSECVILPLVLKAKWYYLIDAGCKKQEYRQFCEYWRVRLENWKAKKGAHVVEFRLGYGHNAPRTAWTLTHVELDDEVWHPDWGEPAGWHYVIGLGKRVLWR